MALKSFGKVTVTTAGTPVRATLNEGTPASRVGLQSFTVSALSANAGANVYVGSSAMVKATLVGVYAIVPKGTSASFSILNSPAGLNLADIYLDGDSNSDAALVSGVEQ